MSIIKPMRLGILHRSHREPDQAFFFLSVTGAFDLLDPSDFISDQEIWPVASGRLGQVSLDVGMPKPTGEVLLAGEACAADGRAVTRMMVEVAAGPVGKRALVSGLRHWRLTHDLPVPSEPEPFDRLALTPVHAFGGPEIASNPEGTGYPDIEMLRAGQPVLLPRIEDPGLRILEFGQTTAPVRFLPLDPMSPLRQRHAGSYDGDYLSKRFPGFARDFDWQFFNVAPKDQRLPGFFEGRERIRLNGFHPDHPVIESRIPDLVARGFVHRDRGDGSTEFVEIPLRIDTLWLFPTDLKAMVIFRGGLPVDDIDAADVLDIVIAYERRGDPPRPVAHYAEVHRLRKDPETAAENLLADYQLSPEITAEEQARRDARQAELEAEHEEFWDEVHERAVARAYVEAGAAPPPRGSVPRPGPPPVKIPILDPEELARGNIDMSAVIRAAKDLQAYGERQAEERFAQALDASASAIAGIRDSLGTRLPDGDASTLAGLESLLGPSAESTPAPRPGLDQLKEAMADGDGSGWLAQLKEAVAGTPATEAEIDAQIRLARARLFALPEASPLASTRQALGEAGPMLESATVPEAGATAEVDSFLAAIGAPVTLPEPMASALDEADASLKAAPLPFPAVAPLLSAGSAAAGPQEALTAARDRIEAAEPTMLSAINEARLRSPEPLYPEEPYAPRTAAYLGALIMDLVAKGESLAGRDMAGADLRGCDLSGLDLAGAKLERANLEGAVLRGATCAGAVFTGSRLAGAVLDDADLTDANLCKVSAEGGSFRDVSLGRLTAIESDFTGADLGGCRVTSGIVLRCGLRAVRLDSARLESCHFVEPDMRDASLAGAVLIRVALLQPKLSGLNARGVRCREMAWIEADAPGVDLEGAALIKCAMIGGCRLDGANLSWVDATGSGWREASLRGATLTCARFDGGDLGSVVLTDAVARWASFVGTLMSEADLQGCDLRGANLKDAVLRRAGLGGASLRHANLFGAMLDDASLAFCDVTGANTRRTLLARDNRDA